MSERQLSTLGRALAVLMAAREYNYSSEAALMAAAQQLDAESREDAIAIAAAIAAFVVTDLNPTVEVTDLAVWLGHASAIAKREAS